MGNTDLRQVGRKRLFGLQFPRRLKHGHPAPFCRGQPSLIYPVCVCIFSRVQLFATPRTVAHQAPLSMEFSRQEYWSGLPFPSPEALPYPGIEPGSPTLQADSLPSHQGSPKYIHPQFSSVQPLSCVRFFATPWTAACQASLSTTNSRSLPKLMSIESVMPYSAYKLNEQGDNIQP